MASPSTTDLVLKLNENKKGLALFKLINFTFDHATSESVQGRFVVSEAACQPFGVLHGGASAYIAESLASIGAGLASGKRIAGIELSIHHLHASQIGEEIVALATPILTGNRIQVWDVKLSAAKKKGSSIKTSPPKTYAVARVTLSVINSGRPDLGKLFSHL